MMYQQKEMIRGDTITSSWKTAFQSDVWYERLNLLHKSKRFCQACTRSFTFWCLVALFTLAEPVLCARYPVPVIIFAQVVVLAVGTVLYFIQLIGVATAEWEKILLIEAMSQFKTIHITNSMKDFTALKLLVFFTTEGEYILEGSMLGLGWVLIFWRPGLATLRCFRVFRLLWFYEVQVFKSTSLNMLSPLLGEEFVLRGFKVLKFAIKSLGALGNEVFRLTNETRGALLLMMLIFYSAFVLGASLYVETGAQEEHCLSVGSCTYTLLRLTFFDGNGFDFAYFLTENHRILFVIVMMYMCMTSFGMVNGLVGIFGTAFARASEVAFDDDDDNDHQHLGGANLEDESLEGDDDDDKDSDEEDDDVHDDNNRNNSSSNNVNNMNNKRKGSTEGMQKIGEDDGDDDGDESVAAYDVFESPGKAKQPSGRNLGGGSVTSGGGVNAARDMEMQRNLNQLLRGTSSRFAINQLASMQQQAQQPTGGSKYNPFGAGGGRRSTFKDLVMQLKQGKSSDVVPGNNDNDNIDFHHLSRPEYRLQQQQARKPHTTNMFGGSKQKSFAGGVQNHNASMQNLTINTSTNQAEIRSLNARVLEMYNMMDRQNEMMQAMYTHVAYLSKQLAATNPGAQLEEPMPELQYFHKVPKRNGFMSPNGISSPSGLMSPPRNSAVDIFSSNGANGSSTSAAHNASSSSVFGGGGGGGLAAHAIANNNYNHNVAAALQQSTIVGPKMQAVLGRARATIKLKKSEDGGTMAAPAAAAATAVNLSNASSFVPGKVVVANPVAHGGSSESNNTAKGMKHIVSTSDVKTFQQPPDDNKSVTNSVKQQQPAEDDLMNMQDVNSVDSDLGDNGK